MILHSRRLSPAWLVLQIGQPVAQRTAKLLDLTDVNSAKQRGTHVSNLIDKVRQSLQRVSFLSLRAHLATPELVRLHRLRRQAVHLSEPFSTAR